MVQSFTFFHLREVLAVIFMGIIDIFFVYCFMFILTREADGNLNASTISYTINANNRIGYFSLF